MSVTRTFIFDFDSTVIAAESLDEIVRLAIEDSDRSPDQKEIAMREVEKVTDEGMNGNIDLSESIRRRLAIAAVHERHLQVFNDRLHSGVLITAGFEQLIRRLRDAGHQVLILSGGLKPCLEVAARIFSLPSGSVFGNECVLDGAGFITGIAPDNPLGTSDGKTEVIKSLKRQKVITGHTTMIGDGISDLRPFEEGVVDDFIGFGVHKVRSQVKQKSRLFAQSMDELVNALFPDHS